MSKLFNAVLESVNETLKKLNENGNRVYDDADSSWYIKEISYDQKLDKFYFKCEEEK